MRILRDSERSFERGGWVAIALLAVVVALSGGASRPDEMQLMALRPFAALFVIPAIYFYARGDLGSLKLPCAALGGLWLIMALQSIPLPPSIWQSLPGREAIIELSGLTGTQTTWRPLSLVPARTLNALFSLIVPVVALLVVAVTKVRLVTILLVVACIGVFDAILGLTQIISGGHEALYPYRVTNMGTAVGVFANQNHSAVFGAVALIAIAYLLSGGGGMRWKLWQRGALIVAFLTVLLSALIGGSRAGLLAALLATLSSVMMIWLSVRQNPLNSYSAPVLFGKQLSSGWLLGIVATAIFLIIAVFVLFDRVPALRSLTDDGNFDDLRWRILPTLQAMIGTFWLFGSGFGSFEEVYHIFEPAELLAPAYVNQAHNDLAQLLIEGGLPAIVLLAVSLAWFARRWLSIGSSKRGGLQSQLFWLSFIVIILFASLVDYPLRTPIFQFVCTVLIAGFALDTGRPDQGPYKDELGTPD